MKLILGLVLIGILGLVLIITLTKKVITDDLVSLIVKEGSLTNSGATFILENHTDNSYRYGGSYSIEKERFGIWFSLRPKRKLSSTLIAYDLGAKKSREIEIDWEYNYGKLTPGKYRIIKNIGDFWVGTEFIIQ